MVYVPIYNVRSACFYSGMCAQDIGLNRIIIIIIRLFCVLLYSSSRSTVYIVMLNLRSHALLYVRNGIVISLKWDE